MASQTSVDICNRALTVLGANPIAGLDDGTTEARVCALHYPGVRDAALVAFPWTFAEREMALARLATATSSEHEYSYTIPVDFLHARYMLDWDGSYTIADRILNTDDPEPRLVYTYQAPEQYMGPVFQQGLVYQLAAMLSMPLREDMQAMIRLTQMADRAWAQARLIDSQQDTPKALMQFPLIAARG